MTLNSIRIGFAALALGVAATGMISVAAYADEFSFTGTNTTDSTITRILVSEDNSTWGYFDVGAGIEPGSTANLVWNQSTNGEACEQWVKAEFEDGSESTPAAFDFCEDGLELNF